MNAGQVFGNHMEDCRAYGVKIMAEPQGVICGNKIVPPESVDEDDVRYGP